MAKFSNLPKTLFRIIKLPPRLVYALGFGPIIGPLVLLLTTKGRVTGKPRVTPLQYERVDSSIVMGSSRGLKSDWVRNILADSRVEIRIGWNRWKGEAEVVDDLDRIIKFLEIRLQNHPRMVGAILKSNGIPSKPTRTALAKYAADTVIVIVEPLNRDSTLPH